LHAALGLWRGSLVRIGKVELLTGGGSQMSLVKEVVALDGLVAALNEEFGMVYLNLSKGRSGSGGGRLVQTRGGNADTIHGYFDCSTPFVVLVHW